MYQSSTTSQDGLAEAIQLLSCRPSRAYQGYQGPTLGQSFVEEQPSHSVCIFGFNLFKILKKIKNDFLSFSEYGHI